MLGQASTCNRFWRDFLEVWAVTRQTERQEAGWKIVLFLFQSAPSYAWWEFRPRKILSPPPPPCRYPHGTCPPPRPSDVPPPSLCFQLKPTPRRLLGVSNVEAQQRYFSYRAMLVAIVSQNAFVLVLMGYRTIIARYVAKWGIAQMCLCETKYQGGYRTILGEC